MLIRSISSSAFQRFFDRKHRLQCSRERVSESFPRKKVCQKSSCIVHEGDALRCQAPVAVRSRARRDDVHLADLSSLTACVSLPPAERDAANFTRLVLGCIESRNENLQENNMRWKALAEIYTMHFFAPFSKLNFLLKNR